MKVQLRTLRHMMYMAVMAMALAVSASASRCAPKGFSPSTVGSRDKGK
jgi:hypothetical protein